MAAAPDPSQYPDSSDLHGLAAEAEKCLEKLSTGLAEAGASKETVQAISQMADICHQIVQATGNQEHPADAAPPPDGGAQPQSFDQAAAETHAAMRQSAQAR